MKNIIQFLIILISLNSFAQIKATIIKTNGEVIKGFANISEYNYNSVKFKKNIDDKFQNLGHKDINKVFFILEDESFIEYQFKSISKKNIQLMKVLIRGDLSLYSFTDTVILNTNSSGKGFGNINIGKIYTSIFFYLSKNNDNTVVEFPSHTVFKSLKKNASLYFKDCSELVKKKSSKKQTLLK